MIILVLVILWGYIVPCMLLLALIINSLKKLDDADIRELTGFAFIPVINIGCLIVLGVESLSDYLIKLRDKR